MNIYQVVSESDLTEILTTNKNKLVVILLTDVLAFDKTQSYRLKKTFYEVSKQYPNCLFCYVDFRRYNEVNKTYTKDIQIPRFTYYLNNEVLAYVEGLDMNVFVEQLNVIVSKLMQLQNGQINISKKYETDNKNITPEELQLIVKKKNRLRREGKQVSLQELFNVHVAERAQKMYKEQNKKEESLDDPETLEQMNKLKQLNSIKNMMQMKQMQELQKLKKIKHVKELEEHKNKQKNVQDKKQTIDN